MQGCRAAARATGYAEPIRETTVRIGAEQPELHFSSMGNHWLLDWPDKQVIEISRTATDEQIQERERKAFQVASNGAITITAAISEGEKRTARALRTAGYPLIVLLTDGFPQPGDIAERYFKPGGVYFEACAAVKLLLLEPTESTLLEPMIIAKTEKTLEQKAIAKHQEYTPIPRNSKR